MIEIIIKIIMYALTAFAVLVVYACCNIAGKISKEESAAELYEKDGK